MLINLRLVGSKGVGELTADVTIVFSLGIISRFLRCMSQCRIV